MKAEKRSVRVIRYQKVHPDAVVPCHSTEGSACADFYTIESVVIPKGQVRPLRTGLKVALPAGYELAARSRSGLFVNHNLLVVGTIDDDYRGEMKILVLNFGNEDFKVEPKMRMAQFKLSKFYVQQYVEEKELGETERGVGGFGSTGVK